VGPFLPRREGYAGHLGILWPRWRVGVYFVGMLVPLEPSVPDGLFSCTAPASSMEPIFAHGAADEGLSVFVGVVLVQLGLAPAGTRGMLGRQPHYVSFRPRHSRTHKGNRRSPSRSLLGAASPRIPRLPFPWCLDARMNGIDRIPHSIIACCPYADTWSPDNGGTRGEPDRGSVSGAAPLRLVST
jgi:hypothetical protein